MDKETDEKSSKKKYNRLDMTDNSAYELYLKSCLKEKIKPIEASNKQKKRSKSNKNILFRLLVAIVIILAYVFN